MNGSNSPYWLIFHNDYIRVVTRLVNIGITNNHQFSQQEKESLFYKVENGLYHMFKVTIDECFNSNKTEKECANKILKILTSE